MDKHVYGFARGVLSIEPQQRRQEVWAIRQVCGLLVDHFDLIALQYGYVDELFGPVTAVLDNQQARRDHLEHEAKRRQAARSAQDEELFPFPPDTTLNRPHPPGEC